jgi:hypothetical protein
MRSDSRNTNSKILFSIPKTHEWYTPPHIIESVQAVLGTIDLDPCSNAKGYAANVPASKHFTLEDDGLTQEWHGRVFVNPPFGKHLPDWVEKLEREILFGRCQESIILTPARTDTRWFSSFWNRHICWISGRLKFSGASEAAPFATVLVYHGKNPQVFAEIFSRLGRITPPALTLG